ncbi:MAG: Ku domain protein [Deltaproteobacteria bacterium]|nr:Ku domain protein [Deltaproteobacteria bacterium]
MAVHALWTGTISFSLVAIPVQLVTAVTASRISFRMLHAKDYSPLSRRMFCPVEERIVPSNEIVRGFEIGPDKYIVITGEELESVSPGRSRAIEITDFIDISDVDPVYYGRPYYLVPAKGGEKAYSLLVEVMRETSRAGVAKFVFGEREYLVLVKPTGQTLLLITLHYNDEIVSEEGILSEKTGPSSQGRNEMIKLIKSMRSAFKPERYTNERKKKIVGLLEKKAKKQTVESPITAEEVLEGPEDLISVLQESVRKVKAAQ